MQSPILYLSNATIQIWTALLFSVALAFQKTQTFDLPRFIPDKSHTRVLDLFIPAGSSRTTAPYGEFTDNTFAQYCPMCSAPQQVGRLDANIKELSGLATSYHHKGWYYGHDNTPAEQKIWAIDEKGTIKQTIYIDANHTDVISFIGRRDWEAIDTGPCIKPSGQLSDDVSTQHCIYIGNIGNNCARGPSALCPASDIKSVMSILQIPEPSRTDSVVNVTGQYLYFRYPDGDYDAESLVLGPHGSMLVLTKNNNGISFLYQLKNLSSHYVSTATKVATVSSYDKGENYTLRHRLFTDMSLAKGRHGETIGIMVRTIAQIYFYTIFFDGEDLPSLATETPCQLPSPSLPQGESLVWNTIGNTSFYLVSSEGTRAPIVRINCSLT